MAESLRTVAARGREPLAPDAERRRTERKDVRLRARVFRIAGRGELTFEIWVQTRNLGLGGVYLESTGIPRVGARLSVEIFLDDTKETLTATGDVAFVNDLAQQDHEPGFGLTFAEIDAANRERLMRHFVLGPVRKCYELLVEEFPHLGKEFSLEDAALLINYWEDHRQDLTSAT